MHYAFPPDLSQLVANFMATGKYSSEDDLLRSALESIKEEEDDWTAISESLQDLNAGDTGLPLRQSFDEIRRLALDRHNDL